MALIDLNLGLTETVACPDITITDITDYTVMLGSDLIANGDFSLNSGWENIGTGATITGGQMTLSDITTTFTTAGMGPLSYLTPGLTYTVGIDIISISTPGADLVIYEGDGTQEVLDTLNTVGHHDITFIAGTGVSYLVFRSNCDVGETVVVDNISVKQHNPVNRNISILLPDGTYADIADKQTYTFAPTKSTFLDNSQLDQIFTFTTCSDSLTYTVPPINSNNDFECMLEDILALLSDSTTGGFPEYNYSLASDTITIEYKEPGIPADFSVNFSSGNTSLYYVLSNPISGTPTLGLSGTSNDLVYTPDANGGKYTITLSVWDTDICDKVTYTDYLWNWCYDYKVLTGCFVTLVRDQECGCDNCKAEKCSKATKLRNLIQAAQMSELYIGSGPDTQTIIDSAHAICDDNCGCKGC